MALVLKDRVRESSTSSGTGSITLAGAYTGYQTFASAVASGSTVYYTIHNTTSPNDGEWEVGVGTFTSPSTLSRDTVFSSSAGGAKVSFSGSSTLEVFITQPSEQAVYINDATGKVEVFGNGTNSVSFTNVTADLFTGNGSAISAMNASNISSGTIANARTTAASANGASTIVLRDASGNFEANTVNAVSLIGNAAQVTNINASNISSGTIANARTTASSSNGASTIVLRGASGEFAAGAITGSSFSGNGASLTDINASNISSGTIANARTTASSSNGANTIVLRDASGDFSVDGITANWFTGNGANISAINASNIASGTIDNARTTASSSNGANTIVLRDASGDFSVDGITANWFTGNGANLSAINASNVSSGTLSAGRGGTGQTSLTAENVILGNAANAVKFVAPGTANNVLTSNGTTWVSQAPGGGFAAGTRLIFAQNTAPTGWTKDTVNYNNHALRVVTGTASTGGTVDFTTAFASQAVSGSVSTTVDNTTATNQATTATNQATTATNQAATPAGTVSISAITGSAGATTLATPEIPSHSHPMTITFNENSGGSNFTGGAGPFARTNFTNAAGGGGSHSHPFSFSSGTASFSGSSLTVNQNSHNHTQDSHNHTQNAHNHTASSSFSGNAINLAVKYLDVITATKD